MGFRVLGVWGFGVRGSGFGVRGLGFGFWVSWYLGGNSKIGAQRSGETTLGKTKRFGVGSRWARRAD